MGHIKGKRIPVIRTIASLIIAAMLAINVYSLHRTKYSFNDIIPKYKILTKQDTHPVKMLPTIIGPMEDVFNVVFLTMVNITDKILPLSATDVICAHAPISLSLPFNNNQIVAFIHIARGSKIAPYGFESKYTKFIVQFIYMKKISKNKVIVVMPSGVVLEIKGDLKVVKPGAFGALICGNNVKVVGMVPLSIVRGTVNWLCLVKEEHLLY